MEGLGRVFNVAPIAAGAAVSLKDAGAVTFVCTGNDTFTVTSSATFGGSYASPGSVVTTKYTNTATNGTAAWVKATQTAANAVTIASGAVAFTVDATSLPDGQKYVKCSAGSAGLVTAILHDLAVQRNPANLPKLGA
jgi:hypothetical protein